VASNSFGDRADTASTSFQVTFLKHPTEVALGDTGPFTVVAFGDRALCSVVDLGRARTPDLMAWVERTFGKELTTRTWRTVQRLGRRLS
jgi:hypothetical protein